LAEELYQKLTGAESVHLTDWPEAGHMSELVLGEMVEVRDYVNQTLAIRAANRLKVRQPLALLTVPKLGSFVDYAEILTDEVNVKAVEQGSSLELDITLTPGLRKEGQSREVIRSVQAARKKAGLQVDDRIILALYTDDTRLQEALEAHRETIAAETLANRLELTKDKSLGFTESVMVEGLVLQVSLAKA
jgi:isoleucyl-tRNA synthetase